MGPVRGSRLKRALLFLAGLFAGLAITPWIALGPLLGLGAGVVLAVKFGGRAVPTSEVSASPRRVHVDTQEIADLSHPGPTDHKWGNYRNKKLQAAQSAMKMEDLKAATGLYCQVLFLDLNGATNVGTDERGQPLAITGNVPFQREDVFTAPAVVEALRKCFLAAGLQGADAQRRFVEAARPLVRPGMIATPEQAWRDLQAAIGIK